MKRILLMFCLVPMTFTLNAAKLKPRAFVHVKYSRMNVFYAKIDKEFLGADLEIYSTNGEKLLARTVEHRKVLIDFYNEKAGTFIIQFKKGEILEEYNFLKTESTHEAGNSFELIKVF